MIRCLIIDDEPLALDLLDDFIKKIPFLELVKKCKSAFEAFEILQNEPVDLIFLDIQMPDFTGIQFIKSLKEKPMIILITAYEHYAIEGYELDVLDYLLKPVPFDRFMKASNKALEYHSLKQKANNQQVSKPTSEQIDYMFVKSEYQTVRINFAEILYIEGLKDYIKIYLEGKDKPVLTLLSLKLMEEKLPQADFIRVHRSFIVPHRRVTSVKKSTLWISAKDIPIGEAYQDQVIKLFTK